MLGAVGKRRGSPSSAAIVSAVRSSMPRKHRSRVTRDCSGSSVEQRAELGLDGAQARDGFVDRAQIGPMGLIQRRQRPRLGAQPGVVAFRPRLLRAGEATPMAQQKLGEPMPRAQQIGADVFATAQQITRRLFLLGRNVNGRQRPGAIQHRELAGVAAVCLDPIAGPPRNQTPGQ